MNEGGKKTENRKRRSKILLNQKGQVNNLGLKKLRAVKGWCAEQETSLGREYHAGARHLVQPFPIRLVANWLHPHRNTGLQQKADIQTWATKILLKSTVLQKPWKVEFRRLSSGSEKGWWHFTSSKGWVAVPGIPSMGTPPLLLQGFWQVLQGGV